MMASLTPLTNLDIMNLLCENKITNIEFSDLNYTSKLVNDPRATKAYKSSYSLETLVYHFPN